MPPDTLATYPYVTLRIACTRCSRRGQYRLARLAARYGAEITMLALIEHLAGDCSQWRPRHPFAERCGAYFIDLGRRDPPDEPTPSRRLRVLPGGRAT